MLRTNAKVTPLQAVLRFRDLLQVENLFLRTKAIVGTRPIFHSSNSAIRAYVFCSFLALSMQKFLGGLSHWRRAGIRGACFARGLLFGQGFFFNSDLTI